MAKGLLSSPGLCQMSKPGYAGKHLDGEVPLDSEILLKLRAGIRPIKDYKMSYTIVKVALFTNY